MLAIIIGVEGIVEKAAAHVKERGADDQQWELARIAVAAQPPARQAIGPDRRQVGHAAQSQECYQEWHGRLRGRPFTPRAVRPAEQSCFETDLGGASVGVQTFNLGKLPHRG